MSKWAQPPLRRRNWKSFLLLMLEWYCIALTLKTKVGKIFVLLLAPNCTRRWPCKTHHFAECCHKFSYTKDYIFGYTALTGYFTGKSECFDMAKGSSGGASTNVFIVTCWSMSHSSLNNHENMPYPVWKYLPCRSPQFTSLLSVTDPK